MAVGKPPDGPDRRPRWGWWIAAGVLALPLVVGLAVLWVKAPALYGTGDAAKTAVAYTRSGILTVAAALIAATAAGAGLYMTARTIRVNQQALDETKRANREELDETRRANREADQRDREAQVTERYTKAIGQLGDTQLAIRLGGTYALERIAVDSERDHRTVVEVLSAFVRTSSQPTASNRSPDDQSGDRPEEQPAPAAPSAGTTVQTLPTDVQAAVSVLGRLPSRRGVLRGDLTGAWLAGAWLDEANLTGARLAEVNLTGAWLNRANLTGAWLREANLTGARLAGANLTGAWLAGANLTTAKNLTQQQLDSARGNEKTQLPAELQRPAHWSSG